MKHSRLPGNPAIPMIIIVYDKSRKVQANLLDQLISRKDDSIDEIIGVKDDSIRSAVWSEKHFRDTRNEVSSQNLVIFIGNSKLIREETEHIPNKYNSYGLTFGWLGTKAVLKVDGWFHSGMPTNKQNIELMRKYEELQKKLGLYSIENSNRLVAELDQIGEGIKRTLFFKKLKYDYLTKLFYMHGLPQFLEDNNKGSM